jgi:hypothetical protein
MSFAAIHFCLALQRKFIVVVVVVVVVYLVIDSVRGYTLVSLWKTNLNDMKLLFVERISHIYYPPGRNTPSYRTLQTRDPYVTHINDKGFGHVDPE